MEARRQAEQERSSPGADVAAAHGEQLRGSGGAQSRCRCGSGELDPGADVAAVSSPELDCFVQPLHRDQLHRQHFVDVKLDACGSAC